MVTPGKSAKPRAVKPYSSFDKAVQGRKIWISGGSQGLGFLFAEALLRHGCAALAIADICSISKGEAAVAHLANCASMPGAIVRFFQCDVRDKHRVEETMRLAADEFSGLDTVVNNAGVADERDLDNTIAVNLVAVITATEAALNCLVERKIGGHEDVVIINISSAGGIFNMPVAPKYSASKHGVVGYTKSMRNRCLEENIRINCFCPGWVSAGMGSMISKNSNAAQLTGIMDEATVVDTFLELFRRRDLIGEAIYVSDVVGARVFRPSISTSLDSFRSSKL